jgi:cellulose synthase/poly-beta-1,6-N-acetylglucosamine synthase-like glycosyltransferase
MELTFYILVAAELLLSVWSLIQGFQWLAMARRRAGQHSGFFTPRVALLCPCRGIEPGLEENLSALIMQDYPNFEIFFILARAEDNAATILKRVSTASAAPAHVVIAGRAEGCGEKVNNLRVAIDQLDASFNVVVFADSDGRPPVAHSSRRSVE